MGLGRPASAERLGGGVSCDVFKLTLADGSRICVKRALPKLRVAADWRAPAERSTAEVAWLREVAAIDPAWVPKLVGEDHARHVFAMEYLPWPVWKSLLAKGEVDVGFAGKVGRALARIHARLTAGFDNRAQFHALRIEPYLLYTAERHPDVGPRIRALADGVATASIAVMHGDVSPKNILHRPEGPVFLDAETACIGDPAFDLAFCLNHLLLKSVWLPQHAPALARAFEALRAGYDGDAQLERRTAPLLAALMLARIDGKSPVEYLTDGTKRDFVRAKAKALLMEPPPLGYFASAISR
jgi:aminoglycoside phosphotransferase (APT) family kinase protein